MSRIDIHKHVGVAAALVLLSWAVGAPAAARAQVLNGTVLEQLSMAPVHGAVVLLFTVGERDALTETAQTATDEAGRFAVAVPPGTYRLQAERSGLSSALSAAVQVEDGGAPTEVFLELPSTILRSALACRALDEGASAVVGVVTDAETAVAVPGVRVVASWRDGPTVRRIETETDGAGRYRVCPPADVSRVGFETLLLGRFSAHAEVELDGPSIVVHDLEVRLPSGRTEEDPVRQHLLEEAAAKGLGDLRGQLVDRVSGRALAHAVVALRDTPHRAISDAEGRFSFVGLQPAGYVLEVRSVGYSFESSAVEVPAGRTLVLDVRVAPEAMEIAGLEVTGRSAVEQITRITPFRRNIVYGEAMAIEDERGAMAFEILRRSAPGVRVTQTWLEGSPPVLCVQTNRRIQRFVGSSDDAVATTTTAARPQALPPCDQAQVVVDGVRIHDGAQFLMRTPASQIESIEFVTPMHAQILYGIGGNTANGVVVVYTRGKGPYASPLRDRRF